MLLVVDVGNTNITFGLYKDTELIRSFRLNSQMVRTSDEYWFFIKGLLTNDSCTPGVDNIIISSVVPNITKTLIGTFKGYFDVTPMVVDSTTNTGIKLVTMDPAQIGADRLVDAAAAYELYGGPVIVIDFGTATTYDLISKDGAFLAGITSPGIKICAKALWEDTAKLPEVEIKKPESILAENTITSMQAGLIYGYIGQTKYIIEKIKEESKLQCKVVATGGLGGIIAKEVPEIDVYDYDLTLKGLRIIFEKNNSTK